MKQKLLSIYIVFSFVYLLLIASNQEETTRYMKPFLMPILLFVVALSETFKTKILLLFALIFSWIGDVILLFAEKEAVYFILGLLSFLLAHLFYIFLFYKQKNVSPKQQFNLKTKLGIGSILVYFLIMTFTLVPKLGELKIPVLVYASVISIMLLIALIGNAIWKPIPYSAVLSGAIFFVISDSLLAFNKFHSPIQFASFLIMFTYIIAQFSIVWGVLYLNQKSL